MSKRHYDALAIQAGACNPIAISRSLVAAIDELRDEGTDAILNDPAVRLICHQLAYLLDVRGFDYDGVHSYDLAIAACEQAVVESLPQSH